MVASWRSSGRDAIGIPRQMRGEYWIWTPPSMCAEGWASTGSDAWMLRTDRLRSCPAGSPALPRGIGRPRGATAERIGGGLSPRSRAVPHVRDQPRAQRLLAAGSPLSFRWCSAVAHSADPTLPRPLSTDKTISTFAGRLPLLAQRPAHPVIPIPQDPIARHPPRLPKGVRSSESPWGGRSANGGQRRGRIVDKGRSFASTSSLGIKTAR